MTGTTFYRLHRAPAPKFSAANAWSAQWGVTFSADGATYECPRCDATGTELGDDEQCRECRGEGWLAADNGYSCCDTAAELAEYMKTQGVPAAGDPVVIFTGIRVGTGGDGEPLAVPTGEINWTTWGELLATTTH